MDFQSVGFAVWLEASFQVQPPWVFTRKEFLRWYSEHQLDE